MTKFTTTLNQIREHRPCAAGWQKLFAHLGKIKADDEPLSLLTVLDSNGLDDALWCARAIRGHDRDFRLFAVWAARQVQHLVTDARSLAALDVAERFAEGAATEDELSAAWDAAWGAARHAASAAAWGAWDANRGAQKFRLRQMIEEGGWVGSTQPTPVPAEDEQ